MDLVAYQQTWCYAWPELELSDQNDFLPELTLDSRDGNRFEDFFKEGKYVLLKNYLYNYLLRKRAIEKYLQQESTELILEVGSGISPVVTKLKGIVYSDLSYDAVKILKQTQKTGYYVVADGMHLPSNNLQAILLLPFPIESVILPTMTTS